MLLLISAARAHVTTAILAVLVILHSATLAVLLLLLSTHTTKLMLSGGREPIRTAVRQQMEDGRKELQQRFSYNIPIRGL